AQPAARFPLGRHTLLRAGAASWAAWAMVPSPLAWDLYGQRAQRDPANLARTEDLHPRAGGAASAARSAHDGLDAALQTMMDAACEAHVPSLYAPSSALGAGRATVSSLCLR